MSLRRVFAAEAEAARDPRGLLKEREESSFAGTESRYRASEGTKQETGAGPPSGADLHSGAEMGPGTRLDSEAGLGSGAELRLVTANGVEAEEESGALWEAIMADVASSLATSLGGHVGAQRLLRRILRHVQPHQTTPASGPTTSTTPQVSVGISQAGRAAVARGQRWQGVLSRLFIKQIAAQLHLERSMMVRPLPALRNSVCLRSTVYSLHCEPYSCV